MGWTKDDGDDDANEFAATVDLIAKTMQALDTNNGCREARDPGEAEDDSQSQYTPDSGFGCALFDARNAFNELNRTVEVDLLLMDTVIGAMPCSRLPGEASDSGPLKGGGHARGLLCNELVWDGHPPTCNSDVGGHPRRTAAVFGPKYGYFADPSKSYYICKGEDEAVAKREFEQLNLDINFSRGERYLGGFIGSGASKEKRLGEMVAKWVAAVETLAKVAKMFPQTAYTGFTFCLQNEWQYLQHVIADTRPFFEPLEKAIRTHFIPALLGLLAGDIDGKYRELLMHSVTKGGLALRNPMDTAALWMRLSTLILALIWLWPGMLAKQRFLNARASDLPADKRWDKRNCASGVWLTVVPSRLNGTSISADEWRDEAGGNAVDTPATRESDGMQITEERGDVGVHGFWQRQQMAIFDVRIMDTDARSA
ncbi:hypothetical protein ACHAXH_000232 [Discostella pseudostelligera]